MLPPCWRGDTMKKLLILQNSINFLLMLMFVPYLIFGDEIFLIYTDNEVSTLCVNQFVLAFINTFCFLLYARLQKLYTTRDGFEIIKLSETHMKILVAIGLTACIIFGILQFQAEAWQYILLCCLHALAVLTCSGVIKQMQK